MSHPLCYTVRMTIKNDMKENTMKANNLILGAIYINATTGEPCRLVNIVSCQGVWLETYDGQGYGETVSFDDCHYASGDEVQDFLDDLAVYEANEKADSHKELPAPPAVIRVKYDEGLDEEEIASYESKHDITPNNPPRVKNYDTYWNVQGYYEDSYGNDIRCRD